MPETGIPAPASESNTDTYFWLTWLTATEAERRLISAFATLIAWRPDPVPDADSNDA